MKIKDNHERQAGEPTFYGLRRRARGLTSEDVDVAEQLMRDAHAIGLTEFRLGILVEDMTEAMGLDRATVSRLARDVERTHEVYGYLKTIDDVANAVLADMSSDLGNVIANLGRFYVYQDDPEDSDFGTYKTISREEVRGHLIAHYSGYASKSVREEIITRAYIWSSPRDGDPFLKAPVGMAVDNGFLAFDDEAKVLKLIPHSRDNLARNKVEANWNPSAEAPRFEAALLRVLGGRRDALEVILQFLGCTIFGARPAHDQARSCLFLLGPARTGKSSIIQFASLFFKPQQVAHLAPHLWGKAENLVTLASTQLCVCTELNPEARLNGAVLKQVLTGEAVNVRFLRQDMMSTTILANHIWAANLTPRIAEHDRSMFRRFVSVQMGQSLSSDEARGSLIDIARDEAEGVVRLLADAFLRAQVAGYYSIPPESDRIVTRMQFGTDIAAYFARHYVEAAPGKRLWSSEIQDVLPQVAAELGVDPSSIHTGTLRRVSERLGAEYNVVNRRSNGRPFYEGVSLITPLKTGETASLGLREHAGDGFRRIDLEDF